MIIGIVSIGIAIGYIGGFLTFYNTLSDVESINAAAIRGELDSLKDELAKSNMRVSLLMEDNEKLRSSFTQMRADNESLQKRVHALQVALKDPNGSLARIENSVRLIHMISGPMPFQGEELSEWRLSVVNESAKLDPELVPDILKLVDSWVDVVRLEEDEQETNSPAWNRWNVEWQNKALVFIESYSRAVTRLTDIAITDIDTVKALI